MPAVRHDSHYDEAANEETCEYEREAEKGRTAMALSVLGVGACAC